MFSMGSCPAQPIFILNRVHELPNYFSQYMLVVTNKHYDKLKFIIILGGNMKKIQITVMRIACYQDLMEQYENPMQDACAMQVGQVFVADGWRKPEGFCDSAWETISPFVMTLAHGGQDIYEGWMKNPRSAMLSCNDGFRPVSFYIEVIEEE